jgi:hypothetical protein
MSLTMHEDFEEIGIERDTRSREEREIESLNGFLAGRYWSTAPDEDGISGAAYVIAGVDPHRTMGSGDYRGWAFLPGGLGSFGWDAYPKDPHDLDQLSDDIRGRARIITAILETHGPDRPEVLVRSAMNRGVRVPWIDRAPHLLSDTEPAEKRPSRMSLAQGKRARERHANDERIIALNRVGRPLFDKWYAQDPQERAYKTVLARRIMDALVEDDEDSEPLTERAVLAHIKKWFTQSETAGDDL